MICHGSAHLDQVALYPSLDVFVDETSEFETRGFLRTCRSSGHRPIRAVDSKGNEDDNTRVVRAKTLKNEIKISVDGKFKDWKKVPLFYKDKKDVAASAGPDWTKIKVHNDDENLYIYFESDDAFNLDGSPTYAFSRTLISIDVDNNPFTGWTINTAGTEIVLAGDSLYQQSATVFAETFLQTVQVNPTTNIKKCELAIPLSHLDNVYGANVSHLRLVFTNDDASDNAPDSGHLEYNLVR